MNARRRDPDGPTAVLRIGGIDVVTISRRIQTIDLQVFLSQGIDPVAKSVVVVQERAGISAPPTHRSPAASCWSIPAHLLARHLAAEIRQAAPADLAARRHQRPLCRRSGAMKSRQSLAVPVQDQPQARGSRRVAFTVQAHIDLNRQTVYVYIADEARRSVASKAVAGLIIAREPVTSRSWQTSACNAVSINFKAATAGPFHSRAAGHRQRAGLRLSVRCGRGRRSRPEDQAGTILNRSEVPPVVLVQDLGLQPGGTRVSSLGVGRRGRQL